MNPKSQDQHQRSFENLLVWPRVLRPDAEGQGPLSLFVREAGLFLFLQKAPRNTSS